MYHGNKSIESCVCTNYFFLKKLFNFYLTKGLHNLPFQDPILIGTKIDSLWSSNIKKRSPRKYILYMKRTHMLVKSIPIS